MMELTADILRCALFGVCAESRLFLLDPRQSGRQQIPETLIGDTPGHGNPNTTFRRQYPQMNMLDVLANDFYRYASDSDVVITGIHKKTWR
jgi:hypothetical protein